MKYKVLFLGVDCDVSRMIFHAIKDDWEVEKVIFEQPLGLIKKMKFRIKKLGVLSVIGQLLFKITCDFFIVPFSTKRRLEILQEHNCRMSPIPDSLIFQIEDIHKGDWNTWLHDYTPDFIMINGTRIIKKGLLNTLNVPIINIHAGITPMYRGVHGGYWALVNNDSSNFGATIHLVDAGVDTGKVLKHVFSKPKKEDNFYTYPYVQFSAATKELVNVVECYMKDKDRMLKQSSLPTFSNQWYYPTLFNYIYFRIAKGIK